jgi:hypothetical protein
LDSSNQFRSRGSLQTDFDNVASCQPLKPPPFAKCRKINARRRIPSPWAITGTEFQSDLLVAIRKQRPRRLGAKTRRVEAAGLFGSRYELRGPRYLIDIAKLLRTGYRLSRPACAAIRCRLRFLTDRRQRFIADSWSRAKQRQARRRSRRPRPRAVAAAKWQFPTRGNRDRLCRHRRPG